MNEGFSGSGAGSSVVTDVKFNDGASFPSRWRVPTGHPESPPSRGERCWSYDLAARPGPPMP